MSLELVALETQLTCNLPRSSFLLPTEIPTASLRAATLSWSFGWSYTTAVITTFVIPQIIAPDAGNLGAKAFLIFGAIMALFIVFTYFFL